MILIIEDNPIWHDIYARLFKNQTLTFCTNVLQALSTLDYETPKLIILDILLHGPSAFTLLNEIQSYPQLAQIPIIVVSDTHFSETQLLDYHIVKIFDKSTLDPTILQNEVLQYV